MKVWNSTVFVEGPHWPVVIWDAVPLRMKKYWHNTLAPSNLGNCSATNENLLAQHLTQKQTKGFPMRNRFMSAAALLAAAPLVIAGCGTSADGESTDRAAVNNDASGFEDYFDNNPTGENILSILGAGYPDALPTCTDNNSKNVMLIANTTNAPQTMSVTINPGLEEEAAFFPQYSSTIGTGNCAGYGELPNTQYLTVQPGQTAVALLVAGGGDRNLLETSKDIAIGAGGQQWYNFELNLDANEGFDNLQLSYEGTGGTDPSLNLQPGLFNVMECSIDGQPANPDALEEIDELGEALRDSQGSNGSQASNGSSIAITNTVLSTYWDQLRGIPPWNGVNYGTNRPMCFAFIGEGANVYVPPAPAAAAPTPAAPAPATTPTDSNTPAPAPTPVATPTDGSAPAPTPTPTATSTIAAWDSRAAYKIGDLVTYQGSTYRCIEAYQGYGDPSWITAPDLWVKVS